MKIAQVAPLFESVPPTLYGGTERVVSWLTEGLVDAGHDVTLFATGDSLTHAKLISSCPKPLRTATPHQAAIYHMMMLADVADRFHEFDIVHFHCDFQHFALSRNFTAHLTTLHGRLDIPDLVPLYDRFPKQPVVSISNAQRKPLPHLNWLRTVLHGMPKHWFYPKYEQGQYLAFLGRISLEKRCDRAIEIAKQFGMKLKIAAKIDPTDRKYYEERIAPLIEENGPDIVEYIGEVGGYDKQQFLENAYALVFPIDWPEPFGLVMIEALACGTPVVAYNHGSVPEVIQDGVTGYIVNSEQEAVTALKKIKKFDRKRCRKVFEEKFCVERMVSDYLDLYEDIVEQSGR